MKIFSHHNMIKFLKEFKYIELKYDIKKNDDLYYEFEEFESSLHTLHLSKKSTSPLLDSIDLVYGDHEQTYDFVSIYNIVMSEIINKFLNIPGTEMLFDEHFFEFEWDMHSRMNFKKHEISFYRDHFVHQVRNLFEIYTVIHDVESVYDNIEEILLNPGYSKISFYISNALTKIVGDMEKKPRELALLNKLFENKVAPGSIVTKTDFIKKHYAKYIIYASSMLAALFHDIGYPINHFLMLRKRISEYLPVLHMLINSSSVNFDTIRNTLSQSLLFRVVSANEIMERLESNDHGVISSIAFLLQLYETGSVYTLSEEKRTAVELAALIIYNHTLVYKYISPKDKAKKYYYRPIFAQNPLSYLFRLCDDIQEWERTYFEIRDSASIIFCSKCKTPLLRQLPEPNKKNPYTEYTCKYICRCNDGQVKAFKNKQFGSRKIINVCTIKRLYVLTEDNVIKFKFDYNPYSLLTVLRINPLYAKKRIEDLNGIKRLVWGQKFANYNATLIEFSISANPLILKTNIVEEFIRCICLYNTRVKHAIKKYKEIMDTSKTHTLLKRENYAKYIMDTIYIWDAIFGDEYAKIDDIYHIEGKISSLVRNINPIIVFFNNTSAFSGAVGKSDFTQHFDQYNDKIYNAGKTLVEKFMRSTNEVIEHSTHNFMFYLVMAFVKKIFNLLPESKTIKPDALHAAKRCCITEIISYATTSDWYKSGCTLKLTTDENLSILLSDLAEQIAKEQKIDNYSNIYNSNYESYMESGDHVYSAISKYMSAYHKFNNGKDYCLLDFNTDLYLFKQLNNFSECFKDLCCNEDHSEMFL